jgi:hypothetical protein
MVTSEPAQRDNYCNWVQQFRNTKVDYGLESALNEVERWGFFFWFLLKKKNIIGFSHE